MSKHRRRRRIRRAEHAQRCTAKRTVLAGAGLSLGATLVGGGSAQAADFQVTNLNDSGPGSLRQAILDANATPGADRALFQSTLTGQITLGGQLPQISDAIEILGPGPDKLTINANNSSRIFYVYPASQNAPVTISGLKLTGGRTSDTSGAILSKYASLTVANAVISGNNTTGTGGPGGGGGIDSLGGSLTVRSSTISGNTSGRDGGGIYFIDGDPTPGLTIESSTITGNTAADRGGGVSFEDFGPPSPLTIRNSTISGNSAGATTYGGGGIQVSLQMPGVVVNTIVADNTSPSGPDVAAFPGSSPLDASFSLIENPASGTVTGGPNIIGQDPKLLALADNGGPTPTQALDPASPAIDQGQASGVDQRGAPRPFDFAGIALAGDNDADIGAYERVLCANVLVNRVGTAGNDNISGTPGADGVLAQGGNDVVSGLAGNDAACGGPGRDKLKGGAGRDTLLGEGGKDKLKGGKGNDKLKGGPGADVLIGGKGKDKLKGGKGKDKQKQ
jgi:Ca2+-binding RTX toxin-like protein